MFGQQTAAVGSSKPVCKYFVKGKCKYGTQCWNYHPPNQGGNTMPNSFLGGSSNVFGGGKANTQQEAKNEFQDFVKQVSGEMTQWERSGQWLVSSFSPLKGHPPFSGFHDTSPEEFRLKAYEALKTNTSSAYQAHWSEMQQRFKQFRDAIKTSTPEAFQAMTEVFFNKNSTEGQPEQQQQQQQQAFKQPGMFEKPTGPNVFGGASQSTSGGGVGLLGAKPQSSVFGATPAVFGGNQSTSSSVFGGNVNKPVFGGQSMLGAQNMATFPNQSSNLFGGNNNTFTNTNQSTQASNLFGGNQSQTNNNSMFGSSNNNTSVVQNQTTSNVFGEQNKGPTTATTGTNNMFNNQNQASMFGGSTTPTTTTTTMISQGNLFGNQQQQPQQQQTSLFGNPQQQQQQQPQQTSLFGNPPPQQQPQQQQQQQTSIFGNPQQQQQQPQQQTSSVFGSTSVFGNNPTNQPPTQTTPTQPSATPSVFGGTPATKPANNNNIFGGFGGSNTQSGNAIFGGNAATSSSVFASPSTNTGTGFFGKPSSDSIQPSGSTSIFGDTTLHSQAQGYYGSVAREHPEWYTPLDQLKQEEKAQFEAEAFTLIPLCPPPVELCA